MSSAERPSPLAPTIGQGGRPKILHIVLRPFISFKPNKSYHLVPTTLAFEQERHIAREGFYRIYHFSTYILLTESTSRGQQVLVRLDVKALVSLVKSREMNDQWLSQIEQ